jgi:hypothetical protein
MNSRSDAEIMRASLEESYVGGGYYNPVEEFMKVARRLESQILTNTFNDLSVMSIEGSAPPTFVVTSIYLRLRDLLDPDELLFGVYERPQYRFAVLIHREERLVDFESQVASDALTSYGFFGLGRSQATKGLMRVFLPALPKVHPETWWESDSA